MNIDWPNSIINIFKADMVQIQVNPTEIYQLDMDVLRLALKDLEDSEQGHVWLKTHDHNPPVTVSGATLARVVEILAPYTVTFEDGQYAVNVVGANTNLGDRTNVNQVSVRTSNSAGLQDLNSLQAASFGGKVALDVNSPFSGTTFPVGIRANPVNNLADALLIAQARGLHIINVMSSMTFSGGDFSSGYRFDGDSPTVVTVTIDPAVDVTNCEFRDMTVQGTLDGFNTFKQCHIANVNYFNGEIVECALEGTITLGGGGEAGLYDCWSGVAGGGPGQTPTIDFNGAGNQLLMRNYAGGIKLINGTSIGDSSLDMNSGRVVVDSTCTGGDLWVRGIAEVVDQSTGTFNVWDKTLTKEATEARKLIDADRVLSEGSSGNMQWIDADDGVTVLRTKNVKNKSGGAIALPDNAPAEERKA